MPTLDIAVRELPPPTNTNPSARSNVERALTPTAAPTAEVATGGNVAADQWFVSRFVSAIAGAIVGGAKFVPESRRDIMLVSPEICTFDIFTEHVLTLSEAKALARRIYDAAEANRRKFFEEDEARDEALAKMYDL